MKLPAVDNPPRYQGLYLFDFGEWTSLGYTADEIAVLLEDPQYAEGRVYKVHAASPDGQFSLRGVSRERFSQESGMMFYRARAGRRRARLGGSGGAGRGESAASPGVRTSGGSRRSRRPGRGTSWG